MHARNTADRQPLVRGSKVSFVYEPDEKGGKATEVVVEEAAEAPVDETVRETGTVKVQHGFISARPGRYSVLGRMLQLRKRLRSDATAMAS